MQKRLLHNYLYVNWRMEAKRVYLTIDEFNDLYTKIKSTRTLAKSNTKRIDFTYENTYTYSENGYWRFIYLKDDNNYIIYKNHSFDDKINEQCKTNNFVNVGTESRKIVNKLFLEDNKITERKAFGYCDRHIINKCVPKSFYYINQAYTSSLSKIRIIPHTSKVDFSSNYPSNLLGDLPDWHNHLEVKGTVKPSKEYPFAYYIKSGHIAEYGRFDSHKWLENEMAVNMLNNKRFELIPEENDITILCKKSQYNFNSVLAKLYEAKQNKESIDNIPAKLVLNSFIGTMHRTIDKTGKCSKTYRLDHIAAVVLARANQLMLDTYNKLRFCNIEVLQIIVDGIVYKSKKAIGIPDENKTLGSLVQEITDANFVMRGVNSYMFFDNNMKYIEDSVRHGSYNADIYTDKPEDIMKWRKEVKCYIKEDL